jgi:recombination protein RecT
MEKTNKLVQFKSETDLKVVLAQQYMKQIENFFGDPQLAREFLSNVVASVQRVPKLMECTPETLLNSFVTMASLKLMPSGVSGEAFVLPYANKGVMEAQFQLGYQGLVTLFYRAGVRSIVAEIVRKNDDFTYLNGEVMHRPDVFSDDRGEAIGAYVVVELQSGGRITKVMSKTEIMAIGEKFSKSYKSDFSPWKSNDPQLWMWKKTVLKQAAKLIPKNETIYRAIAEDNKDSVIPERASTGLELAPVAVELDALRKSLRECHTKADLERVWADMPGDARKALKEDMEAVKAMIVSEASSEKV